MAERWSGSRISNRWSEQEALDFEVVRMIISGGGTGGGGGGDGRDGDGWPIRWENTISNLIFGAEPNTHIAYAPGLEPHHQIMSMLEGEGGRFERERERPILVKNVN